MDFEKARIEAGFCKEAYHRVCDFLRAETDADRLLGGSLLVSRGDDYLVGCFGRRELAKDGALVASDTPFLVASITKPIVCTAVVKLIEEGYLKLHDRVVELIPEFGNHGKEAIRVLHLLTHTSGLPDQLPENHALRAQHAPLSEFVKRIYDLDLLFEPGTKISYQSTGIAILGEIVERIEGRSLAEVLRDRFFDPLGLSDTSLVRQEDRKDREAEIRLPKVSDGGGEGTDWNWNSDYWRNFGAPWGGMFTTAADLTVLLQAFLREGSVKGTRVLSPAGVRAMISDQTGRLVTLPPPEQMRQRWGLGWRLADGSLYGDLASQQTFGHGGATGTVAWADPETQLTCVFLTNDPDAAEKLRPKVSNMVAAIAL